MNNKLKERLELYSDNVQKIKKDFIWKDTLSKRLAALLYAIEDKNADPSRIRDCHDMIKKNTGLFSSFRGNTAVSIATMLSLSENSSGLLTDTLTVYDMMKEAKFIRSDYLTLAAYRIASDTERSNYGQIVERAKSFYKGMKENHWFHTGKDDYIFSAMLGLSDRNVASGIQRMEILHEQLKSEFRNGNSIQALTQVLVLGGETNQTMTRLHTLREQMGEKKLRMDKEYTLSTLGVLSLLPVDTAVIANDISEAYEFLRTQKGFGALSVTKQELLLLSASIVASVYTDDVKDGVITTTVSTSITNIIIAQQMALVASTAAVSASAAAHSSSS